MLAGAGTTYDPPAQAGAGRGGDYAEEAGDERGTIATCKRAVDFNAVLHKPVATKWRTCSRQHTSTFLHCSTARTRLHRRRTVSPAASQTTLRISASIAYGENRPTAEGFKRYMEEANGHAPLRFHDAVSRGLYLRAYVQTLTINTSGHGRKNRRRQ